MNSILTKYGTLHHISQAYYFENGQLDSVCLESESPLKTTVGTLIPRYEDLTGRRKTTKCLSFYETGDIKSIDLQIQTAISTSIGIIPCELITFYENGAIKKVFPRNGSLTTGWTEADEAELLQPILVSVLHRKYNLPINSLTFYPDGKLRTVSFYPGKTILLPTPVGDIKTRFGFSLTKSGKLLSLEPAVPTPVQTSLGVLQAFDSSAIGIHADNTSLKFEGDRVSEIVTSTSIIRITEESGRVYLIKPHLTENQLNPDQKEPVPIRICFDEDTVTMYTPTLFQLKLSQIHKTEITTMNTSGSSCAHCINCGRC